MDWKGGDRDRMEGKNEEEEGGWREEKGEGKEQRERGREERKIVMKDERRQKCIGRIEGLDSVVEEGGREG